ncbi:MAG: ActS/PrrB/RegB family redox-sensitive histidine kinase [Hyphomicrobium sp.]
MRGNTAHKAAGVQGIVNERESQLRLVTTVRLRWAAVLGQLLAVVVVTSVYGFVMPVAACLTLIAMSAWLNVYLSIRYPARYRLSTPFATALLAYDVLQLSALLFFTGGLENPFVVLLVAPVTVSAATLPPRATVILGLLVVAIAVVLVKNYYPLPWYPGIRFDLERDYKVGVLVALVAATGFLGFYTWRVNKEARQMSAALAASDMVLASEQRLHALDGLAAAAAHELGTPLSTIVLVAKELEHELGPDSRYREDLLLLHSQAVRCREILQKLTRRPDEQDPMHASLAMRELLDEACEPYRNRGKRIIVTAAPFADLDEAGRAEPVGHRRPGVIYGLGNIIENAVSFAGSEVHLSARWNAKDVVVTVTDDGPGFSPDVMDSIGEPYVSSRRREDVSTQQHSGLGLGFFIARTLLERSGANVNFTNQSAPRTGAIVQVAWPRAVFELHPSAFEWPGSRGPKAGPTAKPA